MSISLGFRPVVAALSILALTAVPLASADDDATVSGATAAGLRAEYFNEPDLTAKVTERVDPTINFEWDGTTEVPAPGVDPNTFSVRWTGTVTPRFSERYTISTRSDDGVRVYIGDQLVIDNWNLHAATENAHDLDLVAGRAYPIRVEFFEDLGRAEMRLSWRSERQSKEVIPASAFAPSSSPSAPAEPAPVADDAAGSAPLAAPTVSTPAPAVLPGEPVLLASDELPPPSPPVAGERFNAAPLGGDVLVRTGDRIIALDSAATLPVGARLDTRSGGVRIETAPAKRVKRSRQWAKLGGATFKVAQAAKGDRVVDLEMTHGDFESCAPASTRSAGRTLARTAARSDRTVRRLFGRGKGRFRTRGRHAAATVRGTTWSVEDRCDSSIVRVVEGLVDAEDLLTGKVVPIGAGESYVARRTR